MFSKLSHILALAALLLLTACQVERLDCEPLCMYEFCATVDPAVANDTRAISTAIHCDGRDVNRCVIAIYTGQTLFDRIVKPVSNQTVDFQLQLPSNKQFTILFWADCANADLTDKYYNTSDLKAVTFTDSVRNSDRCDAFCAVQNVSVTQTGKAYNVTLSRPFAQLVISKSGAAATASVSYTAAKTFNVETGDLGASASVSYNAIPQFNDSTILVDYVFAQAVRTTMNVTIDTLNCASVPICKNYRTVINIK